MMIKSSKKLLLPRVDPEAWEMFYACIHPSHNGCILNEGRVQSVSPLIQEFMLLDYVPGCIGIFGHSCWELDNNPPIQFMVDLLKFTVDHELESSQVRIEKVFEGLLDKEDDHLIQDLNGCFEFNVNAMKGIVSLCLPLKKNKAKGTYAAYNCHILWGAISKYIDDPMKSFTFDKVDTSECELFANFIYQLLCSESYQRHHTRRNEW
jgi:hypothetical protein